MNLLLCSVGRRVKLVQYFKNELSAMGGKVIAIDCDETAPALYEADLYEIVPKIYSPEYMNVMKDICKKYHVKGVLSLIDPELSLLASHKEEFKKMGVEIIVSEQEIVDICFDKYKTYTYLTTFDLPIIPTYIEVEKVLNDLQEGTIHFPFIVKPRHGSASIGIYTIHSLEELLLLKEKEGHFVIQPYVEGVEIGIDCYIDLHSQETIHVFMKEKIKMRGGETDKSVSFFDPKLKKIVEKLIEVLKPVGPIDIDCFKTKDGYVISEINPRFGGGYPHAHEMGINFVEKIIKNLLGEVNPVEQSDYREGIVMVKYDHVRLLKGSKQPERIGS